MKLNVWPLRMKGAAVMSWFCPNEKLQKCSCATRWWKRRKRIVVGGLGVVALSIPCIRFWKSKWTSIRAAHEYCSPHDKVDIFLGDEGLCWITDNGTDNCLAQRYLNYEKRRLKTGELFNGEIFSFIKSTKDAVREMLSVALYPEKLLWPLSRFHINRLYQSCTKD